MRDVVHAGPDGLARHVWTRKTFAVANRAIVRRQAHDDRIRSGPDRSAVAESLDEGYPEARSRLRRRFSFRPLNCGARVSSTSVQPRSRKIHSMLFMGMSPGDRVIQRNALCGSYDWGSFQWPYSLVTCDTGRPIACCHRFAFTPDCTPAIGQYERIPPEWPRAISRPRRISSASS